VHYASGHDYAPSVTRETINGAKMVGGALSLALRSPSGRHRTDVRTY
jgi:hypothetical protein